MKPKSNHPRRRAMRLRDYDYTQPGAYFVTICVQHRKCLFGTITDGKMRLNEIGQIVVKCLNHIPQHFPSVELDAYVVMPNHIHGIIAWGISLPGNPHLPDTTKDRSCEVTSSALHQTRIVGAGSPRPSQNTTSFEKSGIVGAGSPRPSQNTANPYQRNPFAFIGQNYRLLQIPIHQAYQPTLQYTRYAALAEKLSRSHCPRRPRFTATSRIHSD